VCAGKLVAYLCRAARDQQPFFLLFFLFVVAFCLSEFILIKVPSKKSVSSVGFNLLDLLEVVLHPAECQLQVTTALTGQETQ